MKIGLHDSERNKFPNLALMKLSAHHKNKGDTVQPFYPVVNYDKVYSSKVFTYGDDSKKLPKNTIKGGTGYQLQNVLSDEIEHVCPDYKIYDLKYSLGFLTRGCPNKCNFCFVPDKEGSIKAHADIEEFLRHDKVVLMDNNVLSSDHGIKQIEKLIRLKVKVDFNQGLDARLIDRPMANLLSKLKWDPSIRLACDSSSQMKPLFDAVKWLRYANATPTRYFCYMLVKNIDSALERAMLMKTIHVDPFAQGLRTVKNPEPTKDIKRFCRWVNHKAIFKKITWEEYQK